MSYDNIPQWIKDSKTDISEQNDEVGLIVAGYIGAFVKEVLRNKKWVLLWQVRFCCL